MKIAIFTDTFLPDINGVATSVSILREELIAHGHDVMIVTTVLPKDSDYVDRIPVIRINGLDLKHLYGYRMAPIYSSHAMKDITAFAPDVIHVQTEFGIGVFARIVGRHLHVPVVYTYHTIYDVGRLFALSKRRRQAVRFYGATLYQTLIAYVWRSLSGADCSF